MTRFTLDPASLLDVLTANLTKILGREPGPIDIMPLPQDASARRYYRLKGPLFKSREIIGPTIILMVLAEPNPWRKPDEIATGNRSLPCRAPREKDLDFVSVLRHFEAIGLPVPRLYCYDIPAGLLYLEDLGDDLLETAVRRLSVRQMRGYYQQALDLMLKIHEDGTSLRNDEFAPFQRAFDETLLFAEFVHYIEYGIEARKGIKVASADLQVMEDQMRAISREIASQPRVLVHRDFQSRNIVVQGERLRILDFQDALMGVRQHDLVCLLRDSYVVLDSEPVDFLIEYYVHKLEAREKKKVDRVHFRRVFDLVTLQRKIKDAGRFDYIAIVKGNSKFLRHIPATLEYVTEAFDRLPEYAPLRKTLAKYTPELT
ncbi:MAG: phosphotransferase [Armatimonadetes bacterium]|nr:phosphotransferase [Armatimonadota bacterium]